MQNIRSYISSELKDFFSPGEIRALTNMILEKELNLTATDILTRKLTNLSEASTRNIEEITNRLKKFEPIQYILGETYFFNLRFKINNNVLIPRPETEELVEWVLSFAKNKKMNILDIGTGSGCIAVSVAKNSPGSTVFGWDVSADAIEIARANALLNHTEVKFEVKDILEKQAHDGAFDLIVSNPPYIAETEKTDMEENVLGFEPHLALFVPNSNPLLFYEKISEFAQMHLAKDGALFFEINRANGEEITEMLVEKGFKQVELRRDISGNQRMIKAVKKT